MGLFSKQKPTQDQLDRVNFIIRFKKPLSSYIFMDGVEPVAYYQEDKELGYEIEPGEHVFTTGGWRAKKEKSARGVLHFTIEPGKRYVVEVDTGIFKDAIDLYEIQS